MILHYVVANVWISFHATTVPNYAKLPITSLWTGVCLLIATDLKVGVSFSKQDKTRSFSGHESVIRHHKDHYADATAPEPCKSPSPHGKERRPALCHRVPAHTLWPNFTARMQFQPVVALQLLLSSLEETSPCTAHRV